MEKYGSELWRQRGRGGAVSAAARGEMARRREGVEAARGRGATESRKGAKVRQAAGGGRETQAWCAHAQRREVQKCVARERAPDEVGMRI